MSMRAMNLIAESLFSPDRSYRSLPPRLSRHKFSGFALALGLLLLSGAGVSSLRAAPATYTLVPQQSTLILSGNLGGTPFQEQGVGSHTTTYAGTIKADYTGSTLQFLAGSLIDANVSGAWQPNVGGAAGSAPADYGTMAGFVIAAGRSIVLDAASPMIPVSSGAFDAAQVSLTYASGFIDFNAGIFGSGRRSLLNESGVNNASGGTLTVVGNVETLTLPVEFSIAFDFTSPGDSQLEISGQLVATRILPEFRITAIDRIGNSVRLSFNTIQGKTYRVEFRPDLSAGNWQPLAGNIPGTGATVQFTDSDAIASSKRFYRIALE